MSSNQALEAAAAALQSIIDMVTALEVDYARLEELREERDDLHLQMHDDVPGSGEAFKEWEAEYAEEWGDLELDAGDCEDREDALALIQESAVEVKVRSGWSYAGCIRNTPREFRIVLTTGGPHVELRGELDENLCPDRVQLFYQGWGEPLTELGVSSEDHRYLLTYVSNFYFG